MHTLIFAILNAIIKTWKNKPMKCESYIKSYFKTATAIITQTLYVFTENTLQLHSKYN